MVGVYCRIKETLGEVKYTIIKYIEEINLEGVYKVSAGGKILNTADESIRLHLKTSRRVGQKVFDLDKIQELQNQLVLIFRNMSSGEAFVKVCVYALQ